MIHDLLERMVGRAEAPRSRRLKVHPREEMAWQLIASGADCIKVLDEDARLLFLDGSGLRTLGICSDVRSLLNTSWFDLWPVPDRDKIRQAVDSAKHGQAVRLTAFRPTFSGEPRWWEVLITPVRSTAGATGKLLAVSRDVTGRREFMAETERLVAERTVGLQHATNQLNEFCHSLAHDLRSPLRTQIGFAEALLEETGPALGPQGRAYARHILEAAQRQDSILQDLLHQVDIREGEIVLESLALAGAAGDVLKDLAGELRARGASVDTTSLGDVRVRANRSWLHLALLNLISNACKFVPAATAPRVELVAERHAGSDGRGAIRLWVADNGIGIAPEQIGHLFKMFQRLNPPAKYPGTGMGLANVKAAMERMGGQVGVESAPGRGSRFWLDLPAG